MKWKTAPKVNDVPQKIHGISQLIRVPANNSVSPDKIEPSVMS